MGRDLDEDMDEDMDEGKESKGIGGENEGKMEDE